MDSEKNKERYAYEAFVEGLEEVVADAGGPEAQRALRKLKFAVLGSAWVDFQVWHPDTNTEQALSWAWEDMVMAFKGFGDSGMTGLIMALWSTIPKEKWEECRKALNMASFFSDKGTAKTVARRYLTQYRLQTTRTPKWGFDLPDIVPTSGPQLREWAKANDLDPDDTEAQMMLVEKYERMGLLDLGESIKFYTEPPFDEENAKEPAIPMETDLRARTESGRPPKLTLVE